MYPCLGSQSLAGAERLYLESFSTLQVASVNKEGTSVMLLTNQCKSRDELYRRGATLLASH